jgi:hypothetical protein
LHDDERDAPGDRTRHQAAPPRAGHRQQPERERSDDALTATVADHRRQPSEKAEVVELRRNRRDRAADDDAQAEHREHRHSRTRLTESWSLDFAARFHIVPSASCAA